LGEEQLASSMRLLFHQAASTCARFLGRLGNDFVLAGLTISRLAGDLRRWVPAAVLAPKDG
jgi:hypothetical protein